ncbi:MAG TPA: amidohydrolase family protein [Acidimicrobiia bacterium]|nr:amidohydrolase family protein [Acidimicrobiia bacterium]
MRIDVDLLIPGAGDPIPNGTVVLSGGTIDYAGPSAGAPDDPDVVHVPAVMPGMWDCHAHFTGMVRGDLEHDAIEHVATKAARSVADLGATLMGGVTTIREPGGQGLFLRPAVEEGRIPGPNIYSSGGVLSTTGGHADVHGLPLDWIMSDHSAPIGVVCDGVPEVLKAVRTQLRRGADFIKVCASGGVISEVDHPIHQQFSDEELTAIVGEAERAERVVAAHCHGKPGIMAALRAGARTIEHGSYLDDEAAAIMVDADAVLVPTRFIIERLMEMEGDVPAYAFRKARLVYDHHTLALKTAITSGVTIAMGTDIFISGTDQGRNSLEVKHLIDAGMTPLQAVEAATANGPLTLGTRAPLSGRLQAGYDADVIAFDTDPLTDLTVWGDPDRVTHVWKGGRAVKVPA